MLKDATVYPEIAGSRERKLMTYIWSVFVRLFVVCFAFPSILPIYPTSLIYGTMLAMPKSV